MNISEVFIRRPIGTSLLAAAILLIGIASWPLLPVAPLPQVDFPTIQVSAKLPGASPDTMAATVAQPLERQFSQIAGLTEMTSASYLGSSQITLQFDLSRNIDAAATDVLAAINAASGQLPTNLPSPPTYRKTNPADRPILILAVTSDTLPLTVASDFADNVLAQQISQIKGVGEVDIFGQQKPAIRIQVDPARIASQGLSLEDVRGQLANATTNAPKGTLDGPQQSVTVYDNDQLFDARDWDDIIVAFRNGAPVRVRDIGRAIAAAENTKSAAWAYAGAGAPPKYELGRDKTVLVAVRKEPGANVIDTVDRVEQALPRLRASIPQAINVNILSDRTQTIRASVHDVEFTLILTGILVILVIFVFLRDVPATVIPGVTVPLSILGTAGAMYLLGFSLDNLSLMGLTIATGFVVDDAIVMLENIYRHVENGETPFEAALKGAGEIGGTIVTIAVSLVAVFIPLLLMGGIIGRVFREFALTVTIAIAISVLISLSLTPMLCSRFLHPHEEGGRKHGKLFMMFERGFARFSEGYGRSLKVVLAHRSLVLMVFLAGVALSVLLYVFIPKGFFPQQDTGFVVGIGEGAQDISFAAMSERSTAIADIVRADPDVLSVGFTLGGSTFNNTNYFITLKPKEAGRKASADDVIRRLRRNLVGVEGANLYLQSAQDISVGGRLSRTQYQYTLTDANIGELSDWSPRIVDRLRTLPQLADVVSDQQTSAAAVSLTIDRDAASRYGISPAVIDATIYDAIGQRQIVQYSTQLNTYHVILEVPPEMQQDPSLFDRLYVTSPTLGKQVPIATFVKIDNTGTNFLSVSHQSQFPAITISFNLAPNVALGDAVDAITAAVREMGAPASMRGTFQGTAQAFQSSLSTQPYLIAAALIAVYIVLGLLYESYIHPLTILSTLPSAGVGALLMLILFGYDLSVIALIGIILLIGIVKKNGIMMVDFALSAERDEGLPPEEAIYKACMLRFRPIMMTTMCALLAGLPLMLGHGTGSELRRPLGFAMVGGLLLSQVLTIFTTPVVYLYLDRAHTWYLRKRGKLPAHAQGAAPATTPAARLGDAPAAD
jgi:hydrophobic/amphiphilic exporter-1 (mainly G- bacteria), HAE1 family